MRKIILAILVMVFTLSSRAETTCTLFGEVFNRESKFLLLRKNTESTKVFYENPVKIKIKNGIFHYTFSFSEMEAYELVFEDELKKGNWKSIIFFPDSDTVRFKLFPKVEYNNNTITGGKLNLEYENYLAMNRRLFDKRWQEITEIEDALKKSNSYYSPEYEELRRQLQATKSDDYDAKVPIYDKMDEMNKTHTSFTEKARHLVIDQYDSINRVQSRWKYEYIEKNISLVSYYLIWFDVEMTMKTNVQVAQLIMKSFPLFEKKYPEHIYTKKISTQLSGIESIIIGGRYIDFNAPTIDGDTVRLSTIVKNRLTLIDFWGSWCGPCIAKSRLVVPIYEKYKNKGFEVVGIAREFKNTDAMKKRLAKEQFSWLHLVELDDKQNIWNMYGINNGTGMMVLVDKGGLILAIDPAPEDLEKLLQKKL